MSTPEQEAQSIVAPILRMYKSLSTEERVEMFEEALLAQFLALINTVRSMSPSEVQQMIHLVCDNSIDPLELPAEWKTLCNTLQIGHLSHVCYLTMFILLVTRVADWVKEEGVDMYDDFPDNLPKGKSQRDILWPETTSLDITDIAMARALRDAKFRSMN